jgi:hypothetical protein
MSTAKLTCGTSLGDRLGTVEGLVTIFLAAALLKLNSIFLVGTPCNSSGSHVLSSTEAGLLAPLQYSKSYVST